MLWALVVLLAMLGILLLVVIVAIFKYAQLSRFQRAIETAWFNAGTCVDDPEAPRCKLTPQSELVAPPQLVLDPAFSPTIAQRVADYVTRVELVDLVDDSIPQPPEHTQVAKFTPLVGPTFGVAWMTGTTLILAFRATVTHSEVQDDLMAWQVDWDTGERVRTTLRQDQRSSQDISGTKAMVHSGFYRVFRRYLNEVLTVVETHHPQLILVGGHSLGGAVATLLTLALLERQEQLGFRALGGYVFGTPRVGNVRWAAQLQETLGTTQQLWRVMNLADLIATLPLDVTPNFKLPQEEPFYYAHAGAAHYFHENRGSWRNNHNMPMYKD